MTELDWKAIGIRLKELRKKSSLTIERISEIIGVSTSFIGLVERGESGISIDNLFKLSQVYNVSVEYILTGNPNVVTTVPRSKFDKLNASLYDYTEAEIDFVIELCKFMKHRVDVKK